MENSQATKYPSIFKNCYWGGFAYNPNKYSENIIKNRNTFAKTYWINKYHESSKLSNATSRLTFNEHSLTLDHIECYRNKSGMIFFICSNYNERQNGLATYLGLIPYVKLYSNTAATYMRIFKNTLYFNKFCNAIQVIYENHYLKPVGG